jgi:hypothetical protein
MPAAAAPKPRDGVLDAIDFAVDQLGIRTFAELDMGQALGERAFYAIDRPSVREGVLADARPTRARDQLLTTIERAAERPGLRVVDGDVFDPVTISEIGQVDAILMFNVLLHMVAPDWERALELYAPLASCFVIGNPQWRAGGRSIRLIELGRERFLETVPPSAAHQDLFEHLDEWRPAEGRAHRDSRTAWQWGITDDGLLAKMHELGFELEYERSLGPFPRAPSFEGKAFVFRRVVQAGAGAGVADLRARLAAAEQERDEWRERHAALEQTLADVLGSRSWRLTKPLRALRRRP